MIKKDVNYFRNKIIKNFGDKLKKYEPDYDLSYIVCGSFALLVNELVKSKEVNEGDLQKAKLIIEEMASVDDDEVNNLFMFGFLEVFSDENTSIEFAKENFSLKVNNFLSEVLKIWGKS